MVKGEFKIPISVKRNYKLPLFILIAIIIFIIVNKIFKYANKSVIANNSNYSVIFFFISIVFFSIIVLRNLRDILSLIFGQKGQDSLTQVAKKD